MKCTSLFVTIALLAGLAIGYFARGAIGTIPHKDTHSGDLAAIAKLHRADEECTLTQDPKCLTMLWSEDGINLGFPGPPVVGIKAIGDAYAKFRADYPDFQVLKYSPDYKEMQTAIVDEWAIEVGYIEGSFKTSSTAAPVSSPRAQGMRLLKRQSDGSWKFALVGLK
jgi:hypothetical protein